MARVRQLTTYLISGINRLETSMYPLYKTSRQVWDFDAMNEDSNFDNIDGEKYKDDFNLNDFGLDQLYNRGTGQFF